jgi:Fe2+ or Zn2+ uptake regulation protein
MGNELKAQQTRLRRGKILRLLETAAPLAIADAQDLYRLLQDAGESLTIFDVHELLRDLRQRGCLDYEAKRDARHELPALRWIRLRPKGRDVIEGTLADPAIDLV